LVIHFKDLCAKEKAEENAQKRNDIKGQADYVLQQIVNLPTPASDDTLKQLLNIGSPRLARIKEAGFGKIISKPKGGAVAAGNEFSEEGMFLILNAFCCRFSHVCTMISCF
jgi:hypothetical protein